MNLIQKLKKQILAEVTLSAQLNAISWDKLHALTDKIKAAKAAEYSKGMGAAIERDKTRKNQY